MGDGHPPSAVWQAVWQVESRASGRWQVESRAGRVRHVESRARERREARGGIACYSLRPNSGQQAEALRAYLLIVSSEGGDL